MRILYVATIGGFMHFFKSFIRELIDDGHEVDIATNMTQYPLPECYKDWGCGIYQLSCSRSPISKGNIETIREIKNIISKKHYDIVHCHTPIAAACTRLACKQERKKGTRVIYTAHGFHFYSGAPIKNWILFYPVEKICSRWTDVLITINKEDYYRAKKKFRINQIEYVPGVGIDVKKYADDPTDKVQKRNELGIPEDAFVLLSVGELNINKNHQIVIKALKEIPDNSIHYVIAGKGNQKDYLETLASELKVCERLHLIGYRNDIPSLYKMADVYILPSIREGLNVSLMEARASGLPCLASNIRGNIDLISPENGLLFVATNVDSVVNAIEALKRSDNQSKCIHMRDDMQIYDEHIISKKIKKIYNI